MTNANGSSSSSGMRTLPTVLSSRSVFGLIPSTSARNVSWSNDGQCALVTRQGVMVATPYLTTTLPKPELLVDTSMQGGQKVDDEEDDRDEMDVDEQRAGRRLARPHGGEIAWWMTAVGFEKSKVREDEFGWADTGDEFTGMISDRDKERAVRAATWSPSGLSDLGTPFLAVMSATSQLSVFAPGDDLYTKQFAEIADISTLSIELMGEDEGFTVGGMNRARAASMEWSPPLPLPGMLGVDGSLLAVGNWAGGIDFWACSPERNFSRAATVDLPKPWAAEVTWSQWMTVDDSVCTAKLAIATTDGAVLTLDVLRRANLAEGTWDLELGELQPVITADGRVMTALQFVEVDSTVLLVWAKSGSVHFKHPSWPSPKMVRLRRVGNWAGCNALGTCVGFHVNGTSLTVVLSTLTYHIINDITTTPVLAPMIDSLRATLAARDVFVDCTRRRRRGFYTANDKEYTAHTAGWAALDDSGDIMSWMAEPITFHNLDSATEVNRISDFAIADLKAKGVSSTEVIDKLATALGRPVNFLNHSPLGILMPHLLRILASDEPLGQQLCDVVSDIVYVPPMVPITAPSGLRTLQTSFWGDSAPNSLRLQLVLAQWGQRTFPNLTVEFSTAIAAIEAQLLGALARRALTWASTAAEEAVGPLDARYLGHLFEICAHTSGPVPEQSERLRALASDGAAGAACPACGSGVRSGGGNSVFCEKGHEWERCSVTHLLITLPEYRLCTVCPAVSLLSTSLEALGSTGADPLVQTALEAAVVCPTCGGRWARTV